MAISEALNAGAVYSEMILRMEKFDAAMASIRGALRKIDADVEKTKKGFDFTKALAPMAGMVAGAFAVDRIVGFARSAIDNAAAMEMNTVALAQLTGGMENAKSLMADIQKAGLSMPLEQGQLVQGAKNLLTYGVAADQVIDTITMLGDSVQGNAQKFDGVVEAFGRMRAKGKVDMEQLNRIIEAGVPILQALADNAGVTTSSVMDMIGQGKVSFGDLDKSLKSIATGSGVLAGSMAKGAATLTGKLSNLSDAINVVSGEFASKLLPDLKDGADATTEFVTSLRDFEDAFYGVLIAWHTVSAAFDMFNTKIGETKVAGMKFSVTVKDVMLSPIMGLVKYTELAYKGIAGIFGKLGSIGNKQKDTWRDVQKELIKTMGTVQSLSADEKAANDQAAKDWLKARQAALDKYKDMFANATEDELLIEGARYEKDIADFEESKRRNLLTAEETARAEEAIRKTHENKVTKIVEDGEDAKIAAWQSSLAMNTDIVGKMESIHKAVQTGMCDDWTATGMKIASVMTSAFAAVGNLITAIFSYQQQMIEKQYSHATAAETAYQTYQDQQDAKSYTKMSAKEKKEYNLKKASDKAKEEQEKKKAKALEDLQKKQTAFTLLQSVAQIGMSTAMAIMAIWSKLWMSEPEKIGWTAFVAGLGATEIAAAAVAAAPAMATGGLVKYRPGGTQITAGEKDNEWVVPDTDKVMNGIASRLASIQSKKQAESSVSEASGSAGSLGERLIARVSVPFNVGPIEFGNAIIDVFDKGYAYIGGNRVVHA